MLTEMNEFDINGNDKNENKNVVQKIYLNKVVHIIDWFQQEIVAIFMNIESINIAQNFHEKSCKSFNLPSKNIEFMRNVNINGIYLERNWTIHEDFSVFINLFSWHVSIFTAYLKLKQFTTVKNNLKFYEIALKPYNILDENSFRIHWVWSVILEWLEFTRENCNFIKNIR